MELEKLKDTLKLPNLVIIQSKYKKQSYKNTNFKIDTKIIFAILIDLIHQLHVA